MAQGKYEKSGQMGALTGGLQGLAIGGIGGGMGGALTGGLMGQGSHRLGDLILGESEDPGFFSEAGRGALGGGLIGAGLSPLVKYFLAKGIPLKQLMAMMGAGGAISGGGYAGGGQML